MRRLLEIPHYRSEFDILLIGGSIGSLEPIRHLLSALPRQFPIPTIVATHRADVRPDVMPLLLGHKSPLDVRAASDQELLQPGVVYTCPPGAHISIGRARQCRVQAGPRIRYFRPSIDNLFATAARRFGPRTLAVVMSGRLYDATSGAISIAAAGGVVIAQSPETSEASEMPSAVIASGSVRYVLDADIIPRGIISLVTVPGACALFGAHKLSA